MSRTGNFDVTCLYSTVRNNSGQTKFFGFLPPHGVSLEDGEEYTVFGNILEALYGGMRISATRVHQAFVKAIDRGDLIVVSTPAPILLDATTGATKMLHLNNASLSTVNPCWDSSDSLLVDVAA